MTAIEKLQEAKEIAKFNKDWKLESMINKEIIELIKSVEVSK